MKIRRSFLAILLLAALSVVVLAVFSPSLRSEFVYDSSEEILSWDFIHDPGNLLTALTFRVMGMDVLDFNRPVAVTSLMFDSLLWDRDPFGYHLTDILFHLLVACLVFLLIRHILLLRNPSRNPTWPSIAAFLAALLFAVHPLVTEAVCEPANRKDLLAAAFGLDALLLAIRHDPKTGRGDLVRIFLCTLLCLLSIGSKEAGVAFPAILFLYWFLFRRGEPGAFWTWAIAGSATAAIAFLIARFSLEHHPSEVFIHAPTYPGGSLAQALLIQPQILALYGFNLLWPLYLCADYSGYSVRSFPLPFSLFLIALIAAPLAWWSRKDRRVLFGVGFAVAALLPVCNLVPIYHPAADRYLYIPLAGLVLLPAIALDSRWVSATSSRRRAAAALILVVVALLIPITLQREKVWSTGLALWQDTLERNPSSMPARINLPEVLLQAGRVEEAKRQSEATLQTSYKTNPWVWVDYAIELNRLGAHAGAEQAARRAIELQPDIIDADKMVQTLQCPRNIALEFGRITASLPKQKQ
jgi:tetratricopeptide (TPR) repeat protein